MSTYNPSYLHRQLAVGVKEEGLRFAVNWLKGLSWSKDFRTSRASWFRGRVESLRYGLGFRAQLNFAEWHASSYPNPLCES